MYLQKCWLPRIVLQCNHVADTEKPAWSLFHSLQADASFFAIRFAERQRYSARRLALGTRVEVENVTHAANLEPVLVGTI